MSNDMDGWQTIWGHEEATFGKKKLRFSSPNGSYTVLVDEANQLDVVIEYKKETETWPIFIKKKNGEHFKLSGMAMSVFNILDDGYWYELHLNGKPTLTFYANGHIDRIDYLDN